MKAIMIEKFFRSMILQIRRNQEVVKYTWINCKNITVVITHLVVTVHDKHYDKLMFNENEV